MSKQIAPVCGVTYIDEKKVKKLESQLPGQDVFNEMAELFKVLGDSTRLKIVLALSKEELCVCDLSALINVSVSAVSHQLRILRSSRFVKYHREGKMIYYSLDDEHIKKMIKSAEEHVEETA